MKSWTAMTNEEEYQRKLNELNGKFPFRAEQIKQLQHLIGNHDLPSSPLIVAHGTEATGKTSVIKNLLQINDASFSWISCNECVTVKHLIEKIAASCVDETRKISQRDGQGLTDSPAFEIRPDSITSLYEHLHSCVVHLPKHVLVLDNIDCHREMNPTILSGLARLGERIDGICVIMIVTVPRIRFVNLPEPPYVFFPAYKKEECVNILALNPKSIFGRQGSDDSESEEEYNEEMAKEDQWLWAQCCSATWDTLGKYVARNVVELRDAVDEIWEPLIQPILRNEFGTRDFSKLFNVLKNEKLRNREENFVSNTIIHDSMEVQKPLANKTYDLPWFSKFLVCAAYLASYIPKKNDMKLFMKGGEGSKKQRRGGSRKIAKNRQLNRSHLGPQAFTMERMLAIFHAILPFEISNSVDIACQITTLSSLRLLVKAPASSALDASAKWRVNVGYEYVQNLARGIKFDIGDYLEE